MKTNDLTRPMLFSLMSAIASAVSEAPSFVASVTSVPPDEMLDPDSANVKLAWQTTATNSLVHLVQMLCCLGANAAALNPDAEWPDGFTDEGLPVTKRPYQALADLLNQPGITGDTLMALKDGATEAVKTLRIDLDASDLTVTTDDPIALRDKMLGLVGDKSTKQASAKKSVINSVVQRMLADLDDGKPQ